MGIFVGREKELLNLKDLSQKRQASIVVIKGRRRIGKSRLAAEFAKEKHLFLSFTGLAPERGMTDQTQRDAFARQLSQQMNLLPMTFLDWTDALNNLSSKLTGEPTVILMDEISWMGSHDAAFVSKLKAWWDLDIQNRHNVTLIFCGSVSTWIEENILKSTSFFGRISLIIDLEPLSLFESATLLKKRGIKGSDLEIYRILAVTGGIPWYIEQFLPQYTADQNIQRLCFEKGGLFTVEFDRIFHDLFSHRGTIYKDIMICLGGGMKSLNEIRNELNYPRSGTLSKLMEHLIISGFVTRHAQWSLKTGLERRQSLYRINDPYVRFFLKYIDPNLSKITKGAYKDVSMAQMPGYDTMMGFQVECLLLQNRSELLRNIGINPSDCVFDNPYFQSPSSRHKGCQIDYLVQTRTNNLFVCEIKFRRKELDIEIINEVQGKIGKLSIPRGYAAVPVLFHLGGVSDRVIDQQYFYRIIDIGNFIKK